MITIVFFAKVREDLGLDRLSVCADIAMTLGELKTQLIDQHGEHWEHVLGASNLVQAINHNIASDQQALNSGDEVAFFPPVTGG